MSSPTRPGRRARLAPLTVTVVLAVALLRPDARAATGPVAAGPSTPTTIAPDGSTPTPVEPGPSTDADLTWGTGLTTDGRAERVAAITVVGSRVYLAGEFAVMTPPGAKAVVAPTPTPTPTPPVTVASGLLRTDPPGVARHHLAALDVDKHTLLPWDPDADDAVHALALSADSTQLYVGGDFDHIGGRPASKLARIDLVTGKLDPTFHPGVRGSVRALALAGDRLYVGGTFTTVAGPAGGEG
ncbi:MAG: trimeric autotransporter adhesin, partial [Actinomycetota bacterium]|nr:trimeric autotransporter adhesin [Actinomycetota bacterium]